MNKNTPTAKLLDKKKQEIAKTMIEEMKKRGLSLRRLAEEMERKYKQKGLNTPHYNTLLKIKKGDNYTIHNLILLLEYFNKDWQIIEKTMEGDKRKE